MTAQAQQAANANTGHTTDTKGQTKDLGNGQKMTDNGNGTGTVTNADGKVLGVAGATAQMGQNGTMEYNDAMGNAIDKSKHDAINSVADKANAGMAQTIANAEQVQLPPQKIPTASGMSYVDGSGKKISRKEYLKQTAGTSSKNGKRNKRG